MKRENKLQHMTLEQKENKEDKIPDPKKCMGKNIDIKLWNIY
jgi:hypothetical protein